MRMAFLPFILATNATSQIEGMAIGSARLPRGSGALHLYVKRWRASWRSGA
jgi:hypothetical protein